MAFKMNIFSINSLHKSDKKILAEKIMDLGNIAAGVLIFNQLLLNQNFPWLQLFFGILFLILCYSGSIMYLKKG